MYTPFLDAELYQTCPQFWGTPKIGERLAPPTYGGMADP